MLAPTRELAKQVEREFQASAPNLTTGCYYGGEAPSFCIDCSMLKVWLPFPLSKVQFPSPAHAPACASLAAGHLVTARQQSPLDIVPSSLLRD